MPKKILIAEDEPDMCKMLALEMRHEHYDVVCAFDGEEAYKKYLSEKPDLIILDIMMPKLNGYEVCRKIRRENGDEATLVLMLTAKKEDADRIIGKVIGAEQYLTKPFDRKQLMEEIRNLLEIKDE